MSTWCRNGGTVFRSADPPATIAFHAPRVSGGVTSKQSPVTATFHPVRRTTLPRRRQIRTPRHWNKRHLWLIHSDHKKVMTWRDICIAPLRESTSKALRLARVNDESQFYLHLHLYSLNKVAMYINEQKNKQKSASKKETITCNRTL